MGVVWGESVAKARRGSSGEWKAQRWMWQRRRGGGWWSSDGARTGQHDEMRQCGPGEAITYTWIESARPLYRLNALP